LNRDQFQTLLRNGVLLLDGATGTELQKKGMPSGVAPEKWVLENPDALISLQQEYFQAGSRAVLSFTFGGNRPKLDEYGLGDAVREINRSLAKVSRKAAGKDGLVAGDISATGRFVQPFGDLPFEDAVNIYKEQVAGLLEGGVDFFIIETMIDLQEARAALLAVKESCNLPVCVSLTFNEDGRTLTGTDPVSALITLQALGADAVGCNCSTGPQKMVEFAQAMRPFAKVPLFAKPNAGLPKLIDGRTVFDMGADEFGKYGPLLLEAGVALLGGCCGTSPSYIAGLESNIRGIKPPAAEPPVFSAITSIRKTVQIGPEFPVTIIGERINPTGKKVLPGELLQGKTTELRRLAMEQAAGGAQVLDVNVGMPGIDEAKKMVEVVEVLSTCVETPLCLDSSSPEVLEAALRVYPGRALINSISAEKSKLEKLLPVAAKYGAMFILLPLDDEGVPATALEREGIIKKVFDRAREYGYSKQDIVVDGLVMTVSADQEAAKETLKLIRWCSDEFHVNAMAGLSNVSFGLPDRGIINNAFLAMAIGNGATAVIANPDAEGLMPIKMASDVLMGKDKNSSRFIASRTGKGISSRETKASSESRGLLEQIFDSVLSGNREAVAPLLQKAVAEGHNPNSLMNEQLIPAIARSGELFDKKEYFLPQLIQSAEAMKAAVEFLEPLLKAGETDIARKATIVLATVKGDIHDIGKNIVALMLRNYGFNVIDLGKDVDASLIVSKAKETRADIIGLSALMTTTMVQMKTVIDLAKAEGLTCRFLVGGAVVTQAYADEIGADAYAADAQAAVKIVKKWGHVPQE
jgi:5-methyltetrahydrofolate--homocysteine methyltransferase